MTGATLASGALVLLWLLDALNLRARASALPDLEDETEALAPGDDAGFVFLVRPGVAIDAATRRRAAAFADARGLDAVDLVARGLDAARAMRFLQSVDVKAYRRARLASGRTAGDALAVRGSLAARMGLVARDAPADPVAFARLAARVKQYAPATTDFAVAGGVRSAAEPRASLGPMLRYLFSDLAVPIGAVQLALVVSAPFAARPLGVGVAALVAYHLQAALATMGTRLAPTRLAAAVLLRIPRELAALRGASGDASAREAREARERARPVYDALLAGGTARFLEPRREACPLCGARDLARVLTVPDLFQGKPGRFSLERCAACAHVFQNPRLSLEGLDFYYRDFYDGLGAERVAALFGAGTRPYAARAEFVRRRAAPSRWLDVGAGHGHFCCFAKSVFPETRFDGLDLSDGVEEAERRGWVGRGYRGLFPDVASELARGGKYDVVSMSHYLEHAREPAAELRAASEVLGEGGLLMIEVPDPDSRVGRALGRFWVPWLQPQHQHFLSAANLDRLLRAHAFEPVAWHRGEAHQKSDLVSVTLILLAIVAGHVDKPWRPRTGRVRRLWSTLVYLVGFPLVVLALLGDRVAGPLQRRPGLANAYRVLARRTA